MYWPPEFINFDQGYRTRFSPYVTIFTTFTLIRIIQCQYFGRKEGVMTGRPCPPKGKYDQRSDPPHPEYESFWNKVKRGVEFLCKPEFFAKIDSDRYMSKKSKDFLKCFAFYVCSKVNEIKLEEVTAHLLKDLKFEELEDMESICWFALATQRYYEGSKKEEVKTSVIDTIKKNIVETEEYANIKSRRPEDLREALRFILGGAGRTDAVVLTTLCSLDPGNYLIPKLVRGILRRRGKRGRWKSTQDNVFSLWALSKYFQTQEKSVPNFLSSFWLGENFLGKAEFKGRETGETRLVVSMNNLLKSMDQENERCNLMIQKKGIGVLYYRIGMNYLPKHLKFEGISRGFEVTRFYESTDPSHPEHVKRDERMCGYRIKVGEVVKVRVSLSIRDMESKCHIVLVDPIPSSFEIMNPNIRKKSRSINVNVDEEKNRFWWSRWYNHVNYRKDRVEVFSEYLPKGSFEFVYYCRVNYKGVFLIPQSKAHEMYTPENMGTSNSEVLVVY